ncbi:MAG: flippase-like domain-containing protein [Anaerolineae bacterium]|nr:flippase-like domain-containing protein [Anaerolineae bacterium]
MRQYRNQVLAGLLFITIVLIAVVAVTGADELAANLEDFPLWVFIPVFLLKCLNWALRYVEWRYFLGVIGVRTARGLRERPAPNPDAPVIRERDSVVLWLAGLTLSISPGKLAEVLKAVILKHLSGLDFSRGAPVIFLERLVDGLAVIPLTAIAMLAVSDSLDTGDVSLGYVRAVLIGVLIALSLGIVAIQIKSLAFWFLDLVKNWPGLRRIHGALRNLYASSYDLIKLRHLIPMTLIGVAAYTSDAVGFFLLLRGLGIEGGWTLFGQATFILGFSVIIASLSTLPGGAGGRELTIGPMLISIVGLSKADSGTATFLIGLFQLWVGVLLGLIVIAVFRATLFPAGIEDEVTAYEAEKIQNQEH